MIMYKNSADQFNIFCYLFVKILAQDTAYPADLFMMQR